MCPELNCKTLGENVHKHGIWGRKGEYRVLQMISVLPFLQLDVFPNFKDHPTLLTLHEMVEIQNGSLLPMLKSVHTTFAQHIKNDCQVNGIWIYHWDRKCPDKCMGCPD